jgi:hypothetical protein
MTNIQFLRCVYYYVKGDSLFISPPYEKKPWLFWGDELGYTELTRKQFTSLVIAGAIVKIGEL